MTGYSTVILTLNEEHNLPECLGSLAGCDDIVVLDSGSTDRTREIAEAHGARVFIRPFDSFAGQRNHAQNHIPFRHPFVLHLDADERMTPSLHGACLAAGARTDVDGFWIAPKMLYFGAWIPRCTDYPAWQARLVRAPDFQFIDVGHGQREAPGMRMERLGESYLHELMSGGRDAWLAKHRRYAKAEAAAHLAHAGDLRLSELFSREGLVRRRALKRLSQHLPLRPVFRFVYQYVLRGGVLDGKAGLEYCRLISQYEGFIAEELAQLRRAKRGAVHG